MDWLKESLGEEKYNKVVELLGDVKILHNNGNYIPKQKFDDINTENKMLKEKVTSFEKNSLEVEKIVGTNKELQEQYKQLQEKHLQEIQLKDAELKNIVKTSAIKEMLLSEKAIHPELLMSQIDLDKVEVVEGKINFDLSELKTKFSNMFPTQETVPTKPNMSGSVPQSTTKKQQLIEKYNEAEKMGNSMLMLTLNDQIRALKE